MNTITKLAAISLATSAALNDELAIRVSDLHQFECREQPNAVEDISDEWYDSNGFPGGYAPSNESARCFYELTRLGREKFFDARFGALAARRDIFVTRIREVEAALAAEERWRVVLAA
jgi:hypothetical protein